MLDIHSHILPCVDDGAKDIDSAIKILEMMRDDGITDVIATPHFYPGSDILEDFKYRTDAAYKDLCSAADGKDLPRIYLGSEVLYYRHIGESETIKQFCLNETRYLLLELSDNCISDSFFEDIRDLKNKLGITPIIAHIERYYKFPSFKKLLKFIKDENIPTQVNASSFFSSYCRRAAEKLIKKGYVRFIATDSHSPEERPPKIKEALEYISDKLGAEYANGFIRNSRLFLEDITKNGGHYEKQYAQHL